jgi:hypothetical protein
MREDRKAMDVYLTDAVCIPVVYKVRWESLKERDHSEDQGIDGRMGSEWIFGRLAGGVVEWIQLAQDRGWWWALVNAVMNLWVVPWS